MKLPDIEKENFIKILKSADWYYLYAQGRDYYNGKKSVDIANNYKMRLQDEYPEFLQEIYEIYDKYATS